MKIERELLKGVLPLAVLRLLRRRSMYGYELVTEIAAHTDGVLTLGQSTLYPLLYNLEANGLIEAEWSKTDNGRERKYYRLTDKGVKRLERDLSQWQELVRGMGRLVSTFANAGGHDAVASFARARLCTALKRLMIDTTG